MKLLQDFTYFYLWCYHHSTQVKLCTLCLLLMFIHIHEYHNTFSFFLPQPLTWDFLTTFSLNCRTLQFGRDVRRSSTPASRSKQGQLWVIVSSCMWWLKIPTSNSIVGTCEVHGIRVQIFTYVRSDFSF